MSQTPKDAEKSFLHPRNKNRERYDLEVLQKALPELTDFVIKNKYGDASIKFADPRAVKVLNHAILKHNYDISGWDFPHQHLCPPVPGRADYIHYLADLLAEDNQDKVPYGGQIKCLDVGVGASCIYPIIGASEYDWSFVGSDISDEAIHAANKIIEANPTLQNRVTCRLQSDRLKMFSGVINSDERIDVTMCNPPFHSSAEEANQGTTRKTKNLTGKKAKKVKRNFAGVHDELIYQGGELAFVKNMIVDSITYASQVLWFTTLVSKQSHLHEINIALKEAQVKKVKTIKMATGNKLSRFVAWSYHNHEGRKTWANEHWKSVL